MIPGAVQRYFTQWAVVGTDVGVEITGILRILRILLWVFLAFFSSWGALSLLRDVRHLYQVYTSDHVYGDPQPQLVLESGQIIKAILIGTVVFIVPRLLWMILPSWQELFGFPLPAVVINNAATSDVQRQSNAANTQSFISSILPQTSSTDMPWIDKYDRCLEDIKSQASSMGTLGRQGGRLEGVLEPLRHKLRKLRLHVKQHDLRSTQKSIGPVQVFLFGRKSTGKTSLIQEFLQKDPLETVIVFKGIRNCVVTKTSILALGIDVYELPALDKFRKMESTSDDSSILSFLNFSQSPKQEEDEVMKTTVDFMTQKWILPDICICLEKATEMHTNMGVDLDFIHSCLREVNTTHLAPVQCEICVIATHCDELYPADLKRASEYDDEKRESIQGLGKIAQKYYSSIQDEFVNDSRPYVEVKYAEFIATSLKHYSTSRDYRYNVDAVRNYLSSFTVQKYHTSTRHTYFCLELVSVLSKVVKVTEDSSSTNDSTSSLYSRYAWYSFVASTIALEFATLNNLEESTTLPQQVQDFFMCLGVTNITKLSISAMADQLLHQVPIPILGDVVADTASASGLWWDMRVDSGVKQVGNAAVAYFCERKVRQIVRDTFNST